MAASPKLRHGAYTAQFRLDDRNTFLRWKGNIEDSEIESFGVVTNNDQGLVRFQLDTFEALLRFHFMRPTVA